MPDIAIQIDGLTKQYRIGRKQESYSTLRDALAASAAAPFKLIGSLFNRSTGGNTNDQSLIYALKDVSFQVKRGEVVGIIGRNGAGKSTLLKILSRITEPTAGEAEIHGRVGSLLEVGTGFHMELTGRENTYLNGAILGMRRREIEEKFDEIVDFAEVERFIDTPIKHYSTGMHLRLAFSVAAHLEPEILLVDEVLAVGDIAFQKKCLGKMEDVAAQGRTVLFVSHNLAVMKELCQTSVVLDKGSLEFRGPIVEGLAHYTSKLGELAGDELSDSTGWRNLCINGLSDSLSTSLPSGEPFSVSVSLNCKDRFEVGRLFCIINDSVGDVVVHQRINTRELLGGDLGTGIYDVRIEFPPLWLASGIYTLYFKFIGHKPCGAEERHFSERAILDVTAGIIGVGRAALAPPLNWTITPHLTLEEQGRSVMFGLPGH